MSKAIICFLVGLGFLLVFIGLAIREVTIWNIELLMMAGGFYLGLIPGGILSKGQVLDTWAILIENE